MIYIVYNHHSDLYQTITAAVTSGRSKNYEKGGGVQKRFRKKWTGSKLLISSSFLPKFCKVIKIFQQNGEVPTGPP